MNLRPATAQDANAIRTLTWRVHNNPLGLDWRRFIVAVNHEGKLVGCGQVKPHNDGTRELASIAVRREFRGRGVGRAIIERLLAENPLPLYLTCRASMELYYNIFGFHSVPPGELPPYFLRLWRLFYLARRIIPRGLAPREDLRVMVKWV